MRPLPSGKPAALTAARVLAGAALALIAVGSAALFFYGVELVTGPVDSETTYVHMEIVLPTLAGVAVSACIAMWGLGRRASRVVLVGAGGVALGSTILWLAAEDVKSSSSPYIWYYRAVFVLVLALVLAVVLIGWRLRSRRA